MEGENARLAESALHERLEAADKRKVTVVTPNRRLAAALRWGYDRRQSVRGASAWESPDVLPFDAWLERLWEGLGYAEEGAALPLLMTPAQEEALWEEAVRATSVRQQLMAPVAAAAGGRDAWSLAHAWRLVERSRTFGGGEDTRTFLEWSARFERLAFQRQLLDRARLADELMRRLAPAAFAGTTLVLHAFDILPPQAREFVAFLRRAGAEVVESAPDLQAGTARRVELARAADEHWAAARWARARLEANPAARVGIVVPDLARSRDAMERVLLQVMDPASPLPGAADGTRPFDISLGRRLAGTPLVADALAVLSLLLGEIEFEAASRILRSPFVAGAETERSARARLDARLRERSGARIDLAGLLHLVGAPLFSPAPVFAERLARVAQSWRERARGRQRASAWATSWADALRTLGFPGERSPDSSEYQVLQKWKETLAAFGTIERVAARMDEAGALGRLSHMAREAVFQAEAADAPVAVLGILESAGLAFDHLWIMGMTDDAWPLPARPDPFVPARLQREAGVPEADPAASLALDRRITAGWLAAAREVVVSHARMRGDEELSVSALFALLPRCELAQLEVRAHPSLVETIQAGRQSERVPDGEAPPIVGARHPGGTSLFQNQAACPFRAFARNRLASQAPGMAQPGLDAAARGTLLHHVLAVFWEQTRTREALLALAAGERRSRLEAAAGEAMMKLRRRRPQALEGRLAHIERDRLVRLADEWLDVERRREDFEVVATEAPVVVSFGGVEIDAKIDRVDRLAPGAHVVIDYKTGAAAVRSWLPPRPDEPQLPMYSLSLDLPVDALAFARVRPGELGFAGLARDGRLLPGVPSVEKHRGAKAFGSWDGLNAAWRSELEALGREFASGVACVTPKNGTATCRQCDQQVFCRVAQKRPQVEAGLVGAERDE